MNREALTIVRSAFTLIRANSDPDLHELIESVERLTELGLDPLNTRVADEAEALRACRVEVLRRAAKLMNTQRVAKADLRARPVLYEIPGGLA